MRPLGRCLPMSLHTISGVASTSGIVQFRSPRSIILSLRCFRIQFVRRSQSLDCMEVWAAVNWYMLRMWIFSPERRVAVIHKERPPSVNTIRRLSRRDLYTGAPS